MKFKVREGFVIHLITMLDLGDGQPPQKQENQFHPGQVVEMTPEQASDHLHKIEAFQDKDASRFLANKVLPAAPGAALGLTPEAVALVKAMAAEMAAATIAALKGGDAVQTPAQAPE
jgi:hypothetical protein